MSETSNALDGIVNAYARMQSALAKQVHLAKSAQAEAKRAQLQFNKDRYELECMLPGSPMSGIMWPETPKTGKFEIPRGAAKADSIFEAMMAEAMEDISRLKQDRIDLVKQLAEAAAKLAMATPHQDKRLARIHSSTDGNEPNTPPLTYNIGTVPSAIPGTFANSVPLGTRNGSLAQKRAQ